MILLQHDNTAEEPILRIETEGGSVTITTHLTDAEGHEVTQIEISPADTTPGPDGHVWRVDGPALLQLIRRDPPDDLAERPRSICGCGFEIVYTGDGWQHDTAPWFWGDDHDAEPDEDARAAAQAYDQAHPDTTG